MLTVFGGVLGFWLDCSLLQGYQAIFIEWVPSQ